MDVWSCIVQKVYGNDKQIKREVLRGLVSQQRYRDRRTVGPVDGRMDREQQLTIKHSSIKAIPHSLPCFLTVGLTWPKCPEIEIE